MNCTHIKRLLPLFIGGDLSLQQADSVRAHLFACQQCSDVAEEYGDSTTWLATLSKPDFDERFFEELHDSVWRGIRADDRSGFRSRVWTWAFALAVILLLGGTVLLSRRGKSMPLLDEAARLVPSPEVKGVGQVENATHALVQNRRASARSNKARPHGLSASARPALPGQASVATTVIEGRRERVEEIVETQPVMRRLEIQTADPSIRIIWLIPDKVRPGPTEIDTDD